MDTDKLLEIVKIQSEIIDLLCKEYLKSFRSPDEKQKMIILQDRLRELRNDLK